jgi:hypothetical protein
VQFPSDENSKPLMLDDVWRQADQPWLQDILKTRLSELRVLRSVAHPLYVEAVNLQIQAVSELLDGKFSRYRRSSAAAQAARETADKRCREAAQYLDEVEACTGETNVFRAHSRIFEKSEKNRRTQVDPIRDYLDKFDK